MTKKEMEARREKKAAEEIQAAAGATEKIFTVEQKKAIDQQQTKAERKKPNGDYARIDLVLRDKDGNITHDYKSYIDVMARGAGVSSTKYLQSLIDKDMEVNKDRFDELTKIFK